MSSGAQSIFDYDVFPTTLSLPDLDLSVGMLLWTRRQFLFTWSHLVFMTEATCTQPVRSIAAHLTSSSSRGRSSCRRGKKKNRKKNKAVPTKQDASPYILPDGWLGSDPMVLGGLRNVPMVPRSETGSGPFETSHVCTSGGPKVTSSHHQGRQILTRFAAQWRDFLCFCIPVIPSFPVLPSRRVLREGVI